MKHFNLLNNFRWFATIILLITLGLGSAWGTVYFSDNFSNASGSGGMSSRSGWTSLSNCYNFYRSGVRLGTSGSTGSIKTAKIDALGTTGITIIVSFSVRRWENDNTGGLTITVTGAGTANVTNIPNLAGSVTINSAISWDEKDYYEIIVTGATKNTQIQFTSTSKRVILGNVSITSASDDTYRFKLVENAQDIGAGDYLIVYNNTNALNNHSGNIDANTRSTCTDISSYYTAGTKSIAYNSTTEALVYRAYSTTNGYALRKAYSSEFLGNASNNTGDYLRWDRNFTTSNDEWTLGVNSIVSARNSNYAIRYYSGTPKFAIYGPTAQGAVQLFKKEVSSCEKVTLATGSPTNGTISFSPEGPVETCYGSVDVTMTITPDAGYYLSAYSSSGASTSNSPSISTSGASASAEQTPTLTFAQSTSGTYTASATFTALEDHFIDEVQGTTGYTGEGLSKSGNYSNSLPSIGDKAVATSGTCEQQHYHFCGWVTAANKENPHGHLATITGIASGTTYYAVWAKQSTSSSANGGITQAEITTASDGKENSSYANQSASSASGNWTGRYAWNTQNSKRVMQINSTAGNSIISPTFGGVITNISFVYTSISGSNKTFTLKDGDTSIGTITATANTYEGTRSASISGTHTSFSITANNALYIHSITVTYNLVTYTDSIAKCCSPLGTLNGSFF